MISYPIGDKNFIEVEKISPFISKVIIKILYLGLNPNKSLITKEFADKIAESLRGSCIVGKYDNYTQDFEDHNESVQFKDGEIQYTYDTRPYGFVDINAKIWYQDFVDENETEKNVRTYLCTEGYIWTGVYPESEKILEGNNGQSMQIDRKTFKGKWSEEQNKELRYFIFSDGCVSSLCILGEKIKAGFEGANFKPTTIFSLEDTLENSLKDKDELSKEIIINFSLAFSKEIGLIAKGGKEMEDEKIIEETEIEETEIEEEKIEETEIEETEIEEEKIEETEIEEEKIEETEIEEEKIDFKQVFTQLSQLISGLTEKVSNLENSNHYEEPEKQEETEKEECITNFSALSLDKMKEILGKKEKEMEEENYKGLEDSPIISFSDVNNTRISKEKQEEKKEIPEYLSYIKEREKL